MNLIETGSEHHIRAGLRATHGAYFKAEIRLFLGGIRSLYRVTFMKRRLARYLDSIHAWRGYELHIGPDYEVIHGALFDRRFDSRLAGSERHSPS